MPRRNFLVLLFAVFVSFLCYQRAARNRYADTLTKAMNIIKTSYIHEVDPRVQQGGRDTGAHEIEPGPGRPLDVEPERHLPGVGRVVPQLGQQGDARRGERGIRHESLSAGGKRQTSF